MPFRRELNDDTDLHIDSDGHEFNPSMADEPFHADEDLVEEIEIARLEPQDAQAAMVRRDELRRIDKRHEIEEAEEWICRRVEEHLIAFDEAREAEDFTLWQTREDKRGNDELELYFDQATQELIRNRGDGNRQLGLSLGLVRETEIAAVALFMDYFYGTGRHPNTAFAEGENDENDDLNQIMRMALENQHEKAGIREKISTFVQRTVRHRMGAARQQWGQKVGMRRDPESGRYLETVTHEGLMWDVWDATAVWISDYDKAAARDQEMVIWYSEKTLSQLEEEEAVQSIPGEVVIDAATGSIISAERPITAGRFFRLGEMRRDERNRRDRNATGFPLEHNGFGPVENRPGKYSVEQKRHLHHRPVYGVLEVEGRMELYDGVVDGIITPAVLEEWGVNIGETRGLTRHEVGQRLSRIFWNITLTTMRRLLQFEPCPYEPARNTLLMTQYVNNEGRALGDSITKLTWGVNEQADVQFNEIYLNYLRRNNPNWLVNDTGLVDEHGVKIERSATKDLIFGLNEVLHANFQAGPQGGRSARDLVQAIMPEASPDDLQKLQFLIEKVEKRSLITEILKGQGPGETAREAEITNNSALRMGTSQASRIGVAIVEQIDKLLLQDFATFMEASGDMNVPSEWEQYITRIAGVRGVKCWYLLPTLDGIAERMQIHHSASPMAQRHLTNAMLGETIDRFAEYGRLNMDHALQRQLELAGETNTRPWILDGGEPIDPHMEVRVLANGHFLKPHPAESVFTHFETHVYQLAVIRPDWVIDFLDPALLQYAQGLQMFLSQAGQRKPLGLEEYAFDEKALAGPLLRHITETQTFIYQQVHQMRQAAMQQQAQLAGPEGQQGLPAPGGAAQNPNGGPAIRDEGTMANGVQNRQPQLPLAGEQRSQ